MINNIVAILGEFRKCFSRKSGYENFVAFILGILLCEGRRVITNIRNFTGSTGCHTRLYKFLSSSSWSMGEVSRVLVDILLRTLPFERDKDGRIIVHVGEDSTFAKKTGKKTPGVCWFFDTANKQKGSRWIWGHCWMTLTLMFKIPGLDWLHFPIACGLFVRKKVCDEEGKPFVPMLEIARGLIHLTLPAERFSLVCIVDSGFAKGRYVNPMVDEGHAVITRLRKNSVGYMAAETPKKRKRGRPAKYGKKVKLLLLLDGEENTGKVTLRVYGEEETVTLVSRVLFVKWCKKKVLVVVARSKRGTAIFLCTDTTTAPERVIQLYAARFGIEMAFRDMKQHLGFAEHQVRNPRSIERMTLLTLIAYSVAKLAYVRDKKFRLQVEEYLHDPWRTKTPKFSLAAILAVMSGILFTARILRMNGSRTVAKINELTMMVHGSERKEDSKP